MFLTNSNFCGLLTQAESLSLLFDYDGIFLDYLKGLGEACEAETLGSAVWKQALRQVDIPEIHLNELLAVRQVKGAGAWPHIADRMAVIADGHGFQITGEQILRAVEKVGLELVKERGVGGVPFYSGANKFVELLYRAGARMAIVTSCVDSFVESQLIVHGLNTRFEFIWGCNHIKQMGLPYKPNGSVWNRAASQLNSDLAVIFEDNSRNLVNAKMAVPGSLGVLFTREDTSQCSLEESEKCILESQQNLVKVFNEIDSEMTAEQFAKRILVVDPIFQEQGFIPLISELEKQ